MSVLHVIVAHAPFFICPNSVVWLVRQQLVWFDQLASCFLSGDHFSSFLLLLFLSFVFFFLLQPLHSSTNWPKFSPLYSGCLYSQRHAVDSVCGDYDRWKQDATHLGRHIQHTSALPHLTWSLPRPAPLTHLGKDSQHSKLRIILREGERERDLRAVRKHKQALKT